MPYRSPTDSSGGVKTEQEDDPRTDLAPLLLNKTKGPSDPTALDQLAGLPFALSPLTLGSFALAMILWSPLVALSAIPLLIVLHEILLRLYFLHLCRRGKIERALTFTSRIQGRALFGKRHWKLNLSTLHILLGNLEEAEALLTGPDSERKPDVSRLLNLSTLYIRDLRLEEGQRVLGQIVLPTKSRTLDALYHHNWAYVHYLRGEFQAAIQESHISWIDLKKPPFDALHEMLLGAICLATHRDSSEVMAHLHRAESLHTGPPWPAFSLLWAWTHAQGHNLDLAFEKLPELFGHENELATYERFLFHHLLGLCYETCGRHDEATTSRNEASRHKAPPWMVEEVTLLTQGKALKSLPDCSSQSPGIF